MRRKGGSMSRLLKGKPEIIDKGRYAMRTAIRWLIVGLAIREGRCPRWPLVPGKMEGHTFGARRQYRPLPAFHADDNEHCAIVLSVLDAEDRDGRRWGLTLFLVERGEQGISLLKGTAKGPRSVTSAHRTLNRNGPSSSAFFLWPSRRRIY